MTLGEAEKDFSLIDNKDEKDEEELFSQVIALSEENDNEEDEVELLRQAIALSLAYEM